AADADGAAAIERGMRTVYEPRRGSTDQDALARTVRALQDVYRSNVFPAMNVTWGSYPDNRGHTTSNGCFRCHDGTHPAKEGWTAGPRHVRVLPHGDRTAVVARTRTLSFPWRTHMRPALAFIIGSYLTVSGVAWNAAQQTRPVSAVSTSIDEVLVAVRSDLQG